MRSRTSGVVVMVAILVSGCHSAAPPSLLPAPSGVSALARHHNEAGIQAYQQDQWAGAREQFNAAIDAAPTMAEAHYNLGKALYKLKAFKEGDAHFIEAANLAPGNKVIWDSPALKHVTVPEKDSLGADDHGHRH